MRLAPTVYSLSREVITRVAHLLYYEGKEPDRRTLVSLAATCRYISEPVLDVIWHTLPDVISLLLVLPTDLCTTVLEEVPSGHFDRRRKEFILLRDPVACDFRRMSTYSRRVKALGHYDRRVVPGKHLGYKVSPRMWDILAEHGPAPLLPNLLELRCTCGWPPNGFIRRRMDRNCRTRDVSPAVVDFVLGVYPTGSCEAINIVQSIVRFAPHLRELNLFTRGRRWILRGPDIRALSFLGKFDAHNVQITPDALFALGVLPRLGELATCLDFSMPEWCDWTIFPCGRTKGLFPALRQLQLETAGLLGTVAFIGTITSPSLVCLKMKIKGDAMPNMLLAAFCSSIAGSPFHDTLLTLELDINCNWYGSERADLNPSDSSSMRPLLSLRRLRTLCFNANFPMGFIDDAFLHGMSRSWSDIRIVRFHEKTGFEPYIGTRYFDWPDDWIPDPDVGAPDCPKATLAGLFPLAQNCPHLWELEIPIDMRIQQKPLEPALSKTPPSNMHARTPRGRLREFSATGCVLGNVWEVASHFSLLFPYLEQKGFGHTKKDAWSFMWDVYDALVCVRFEESMWRKGGDRDSMNEGRA
ncbi:hypothetical protein GY45DRAFT_1433650 [Cubamyces sp. BRFM 1775]|nr:hypothetical protein GY45DRAFT_1433650 [Cubamyces sp. BRFM 1775]